MSHAIINRMEVKFFDVNKAFVRKSIIPYICTAYYYS